MRGDLRFRRNLQSTTPINSQTSVVIGPKKSLKRAHSKGYGIHQWVVYLQILFNVLVISFVLYGIVRIWNVFESDVKKYTQLQEHNVYDQIIDCTRKYVNNKCSNPTPAMESQCHEWEICMHQDVSTLLSSKHGAEIIAILLNNFFGHLTDRTIACVSVLFTGTFIFTNLILRALS